MTSKLRCECLEQCPSVAVLEEYNGSSAQVPVITLKNIMVVLHRSL
jgi:hypothetical protein